MSNPSPQSKKRRVSLDLENHTQFVPEPIARGLLVKRHSEKAKAPTRGSALAAGYDLYR
jgi:dUTP pyrophosphatase